MVQGSLWWLANERTGAWLPNVCTELGWGWGCLRCGIGLPICSSAFLHLFLFLLSAFLPEEYSLVNSVDLA